MVRVLHAIGAMDRAGAETLLMNLYRSIDRNEVQFDFLVHTDKPCDYDREIEDLGGRIFHVPRYNILNKRAYSDAVRSVLREHPEDTIMHSHLGSAAPVHLRIAHEEGRHTIAHSHAQTKIDSLQNLAFHVISKPVRGVADQYMACSTEAAEDRFGKPIASSAKCMIIKNGIPLEGYYRDGDRAEMAKKALGVQGRPVFGHVGRFTREKNHSFLLDVFSGIREKMPGAVLLLAGRGELEADIRKATKERNLDDSVLFLGVRDDIPEVFKAMDVFLFPSHHEGLGIAFVEAQATGLECIGSTGLPESAICSDRAIRLPLESVETWVDAAVQAFDRAKTQPDDRIESVRRAGYDIESIANQLEEVYLAIENNHSQEEESAQTPIQFV